AWTEHTTPREAGIAVALGVFVGCSPAVGFHAAIALGVATLFRLNRIWCFLGSRISSIVILPWIVMAEVELAHYAREGSWLHLSRDELVAQRHRLMLDWILGWFPVGIATGLFFGLLAALAFRLRKRNEDAR
ncbi:MAG: DUF2062 domain-containing protein, partial [Polyangiaceae bacterium]